MATLAVYSPYDEHLIKEVPLCDEQLVETTISIAKQTFDDKSCWLKPYERVAILEKAAAIITERQEQLALAAAEEGGKPLFDSRIEIARAIQGIKVAIEHIGQIKGEQIPMALTPSSDNRIAYTFREPIGVVFAISAFNHPFNLIVHQVIPAIAVGCPVIIKPASATPISCFNLVDILHEAGLPKRWCQVMVAPSHLAEKLAGDSRIKYLSFIGSAKVGWYLRAKLAPGTNCALEHGGAAPAIVEADADLNETIPALVKGGFYHAGQVCVSVQRVFVQQKIVKTFTKQMSDAVKRLKIGDPCDPHTEVGPLITKAEVDRVDQWVNEATYKGAKLLCGGKKASATCYEPTLLLDPPFDAHVSKLEVFGPVVCIYTYKDRDEAIKQANQIPFSFQSAIFTKDLDVAFDTINKLRATAVMVNDHTAFRVDWMPFSGRLQSGKSTGGIPYSMRELTQEKLFVIKSAAFN